MWKVNRDLMNMFVYHVSYQRSQTVVEWAVRETQGLELRFLGLSTDSTSS